MKKKQKNYKKKKILESANRTEKLSGIWDSGY